MSHANITRIGLSLFAVSALGLLGCGAETGYAGDFSSEEGVGAQADAISASQQAALNTHNNERRRHQNTPDLRWWSVLRMHATAFVNRCTWGHDTNELYRYGEGENLGMGFPDMASAVRAFISEGSDYNYNGDNFVYQDGHFTQVVWASTKYVGCAMKFCSNYNANIVSCRYSPPGNYQGQFQENVHRLK